MSILLLCLFSLALAEPPVGDSYLEAAQSGHNHGTHQHHHLSDLSIPSANNFTPVKNQYSKSNPKPISQEYGAPGFRSELSPEYGTPESRNFKPNFTTIPQDYNAAVHSSPNYKSLTSSLGQSFSSTSSKNSVSRNYGAPSSRNLPSKLNGLPSQRTLSTQYGVPESQASYKDSETIINGNAFAGRNSASIQKYGQPKLSSNTLSVSQKHNELSSKSKLHTSINLPSSYTSPARSLSTQYDVPETRNAIKEQSPRSYGVPIGRSSSQEYPGSDLALKTKAFPSSSVRSPSQQYGAPFSRNTMPSQEHGAPYDVSSDQAYKYARNALELLNQEPANYEFSYKVNDYQTGSDFGHVENREENRAEGSYFVVLPDGSKQIVEYEADENGFKPRITVEPADSANSFSAGGPY